MKWFQGAHARPWGRGLAVLVVVVIMGLPVACSTSSEAEEEVSRDEVIGQPPAAEDDPFFVESMPGEAVEAEPSGSIGDDESEPSQPDDPDDPSDTDDDEVASPAPDSSSSPDSPPPAEPLQCFSCVRICPTDSDCEEAQDDVICGWGVHDTSDGAKRMAKAECDATLDMARQMPVWSEISGECPVATCR